MLEIGNTARDGAIESLLRTGTTPLHQAAAAGNTKRIKAILDATGNVNAKDRADARPLYYAAEKGHKETVALLVARGARVLAKNTRRNETAQEVAARMGHTAVAAFLADQAAKSPQTRN